MTNKKLLIVLGPTAVGKTEYSVRLAEALGAEIVCRGGLADGEFRIEGRSPDGATLYFQAQGRR